MRRVLLRREFPGRVSGLYPGGIVGRADQNSLLKKAVEEVVSYSGCGLLDRRKENPAKYGGKASLGSKFRIKRFRRYVGRDDAGLESDGGQGLTSIHSLKKEKKKGKKSLQKGPPGGQNGSCQASTFPKFRGKEMLCKGGVTI